MRVLTFFPIFHSEGTFCWGTKLLIEANCNGRKPLFSPDVQAKALSSTKQSEKGMSWNSEKKKKKKKKKKHNETWVLNVHENTRYHLWYERLRLGCQAAGLAMHHRSQQRPSLLGFRLGFPHGFSGLGHILGHEQGLESHLPLRKASGSLETAEWVGFGPWQVRRLDLRAPLCAKSLR